MIVDHYSLSSSKMIARTIHCKDFTDKCSQNENGLCIVAKLTFSPFEEEGSIDLP